MLRPRSPSEAVLMLCIVACVGLVIFGIVAASLSHEPPTRCPAGWKPSTGYLQRSGSCVKAAPKTSDRSNAAGRPIASAPTWEGSSPPE